MDTHGCPDDPETDRPKRYEEMVSGPDTWGKYGIIIDSTDPQMLTTSNVHIGSEVTLSIAVRVKRDPQRAPQCLFASCWTNMKTNENPCGIWTEIFLPFNPKKSSSIQEGEEVLHFVYENTLVPTTTDTYRITFLLKWNHMMIWNNDYKKDGFFDVN